MLIPTTRIAPEENFDTFPLSNVVLQNDCSHSAVLETVEKEEKIGC
jgi:hypothetical protein